MLTRDELLISYNITRDVFEENIPFFVQLSHDNDALGHCYLGMCYDKGIGVVQDQMKALQLYKAASEQDLPLANALVGLIYQKGWNTEINISKAIRLYKRSSSQGHPYGHCYLAECYRLGIGVTRNVRKSYRLCRKAADMGYVGGYASLGLCYQNGYGTIKNIRKAVDCFYRSYLLGDDNSTYQLARLYEEGSGVKRDYQSAVNLYIAAFDLSIRYWSDIKIRISTFSPKQLMYVRDVCVVNNYPSYMINEVDKTISRLKKSDKYIKICKFVMETYSLEDCPICFDEISEDNNNIFLTRCLHVFHADCIAKCDKKCPMCRTDLEEINC